VLFRNSCHCILKALISYNTGAGLIPCPRSPTKCLKGSISKKKNPTPEKGIRKMRKKKVMNLWVI